MHRGSCGGASRHRGGGERAIQRTLCVTADNVKAVTARDKGFKVHGGLKAADERTNLPRRKKLVILQEQLLGAVYNDRRNTNLVVLKTVADHGDGTNGLNQKAIRRRLQVKMVR